MKNFSYFIKETGFILKRGFLSNMISLVSITLIFFILALMVSVWSMAVSIAVAIENEAEISVFLEKDADVNRLLSEIGKEEGIKNAVYVTADEAYNRMANVLGKEARVLEYFTDNPFSPYIEVSIDLNMMDSVSDRLSKITGIEHVRDNRDVLEQIRHFSEIMRVLGYMVIAAAGISTLIIVSHIIRQGVYNNKDRINTLRLLGSPRGFISLPFLLAGLILTIGGAVLSLLLISFALKFLYGSIKDTLSFIPLPPMDQILLLIKVTLMAAGVVLGITGSLFGLSSEKKG